MKSSRFSLFIAGLIVFLGGATLFIVNYELWFEMPVFWTSLLGSMIGIFMLGMAANKNKAGQYRSFEELRSDSFKIVMFKQIANRHDIDNPTIEMLAYVPTSARTHNSIDCNFYTSVGSRKFIDPPMKDTWYFYKNGGIIQDVTRSPKKETAVS